MDDRERDRKFKEERRRQMQRMVLIQAETYKEIEHYLKTAQTQILATLAQTPSSFESWRLGQLQVEVRRALDVFERGAVSGLLAGLDASWTAGGELVTQSLAAGGIDLGGRLPALDPRLLVALKSFQTDKIRDISTTTINRVNQEIGQVAIGVRSTHAAAELVADLLDAPASRARTIVRTELGTAYSEAGQQRMEQAVKLGVAGLQKQWRRSGKLNPRITHDLADGQIVDVDKPFIVGGIEIPKPRDPSIPVGDRVNCGCASLPHMAHWRVAIPGRREYTADEIARSRTARQVEEVRATPPSPAPPVVAPAPPTPFHLRMERVPSPLTEAELARMPRSVAEWHRDAWPHVDDVLRQAILAKEPPRLLVPAPSGAFASWDGGIMMSHAYREASKDERSVVWRHEFGHHLDMRHNKPASYLPREVASVDALQAMERTLARWDTVRAERAPEDLLGRGGSRERMEAYWRAHGVEGVTLDDVSVLASDGAPRSALLDALRLRDPEKFLLAWQPRSAPEARLQVMVSDFIEAVSKCKMAGAEFGVGGHRRAYYDQSPIISAGYTGRHAIEAFANWVAIRSDGLQQIKVILAQLAPEVVEAFERILKEMVGG